jgi:hypothetical protein
VGGKLVIELGPIAMVYKPCTCLHSHAEHGILLSVIIPGVDTEQGSKIVLVHSLLVLVDPVSPLCLRLVGLEIFLIQVLHIDFRE